MDYRKCSVCKTEDDCENMIMDLQEILDCSEQRIQEWESNNPNIDLQSWFCWDCSTKVGTEIERGLKTSQLEKNMGVDKPVAVKLTGESMADAMQKEMAEGMQLKIEGETLALAMAKLALDVLSTARPMHESAKQKAFDDALQVLDGYFHLQSK